MTDEQKYAPAPSAGDWVAKFRAHEQRRALDLVHHLISPWRFDANTRRIRQAANLRRQWGESTMKIEREKAGG